MVYSYPLDVKHLFKWYHYRSKITAAMHRWHNCLLMLASGMHVNHPCALVALAYSCGAVSRAGPSESAAAACLTVKCATY